MHYVLRSFWSVFLRERNGFLEEGSFFLEGRKEDDKVVKRYGYTYMRKILELHLCTNVSSFFSPGISSFFCKMYQLEVKNIYRCGKETIYEVAKKISNTLWYLCLSTCGFHHPPHQHILYLNKIVDMLWAVPSDPMLIMRLKKVNSRCKAKGSTITSPNMPKKEELEIY